MNTSARVEILESEIAAVKAQNDRLNEENIYLRDQLNRLTTNTRSTAAVNVEAKIKAFQLEDERDQLLQNLEKLKKKYNKLHEAYTDKVKRCKILENTFQRQKTLTGLVMKSAIKQRNEEIAALKATECFEPKLIKLQNELAQAYDIIDEMEFELETVELLELENQRLRQELSAIKNKYEKMSKSNNVSAASAAGLEGPPSYNQVQFARMSTDCNHGSSESICEECSNQFDVDHDTLERTVLTESVMENVEAESNMLRRELIKCRLQKRKEPRKEEQ